jgi:hypothetical protein
MWATGCLVVPFLILGAGWCVALPVALLDGRGPTGALGRSWAMTRGARWRVLVGFGVVMLPSLALALPLQLVLRPALSGLTHSYGELMATMQVVSGLLGGLTSPLVSVAMAVAYHQLREETEGPVTAQLGRVFE